MSHASAPSATPRWRQLLAGALLGIVPGVILLLLAQFVVTGEQELTVGVAGFWLVAIGAVAGLLVAHRRSRDR